jgi:prolyl-tRNA editing enzyme YbaK/EbsC (Cys-tRNA(Pro) deacylase)
VFAERSIRNLAEIYINGGRRGLLLRIRPADLEAGLGVTWVDVALA